MDIEAKIYLFINGLYETTFTCVKHYKFVSFEKVISDESVIILESEAIIYSYLIKNFYPDTSDDTYYPFYINYKDYLDGKESSILPTYHPHYEVDYCSYFKSYLTDQQDDFNQVNEEFFNNF